MPAPVVAGAWIPARGHSYLELSTVLLTTDERFDADGQRAGFTRITIPGRQSTYRDVQLVLYGELGLGHGLGLVASGTWRRTEAEEPAVTFATYGLGDVRLGLKGGSRAGPAVWAVAGEIKVPLGYDELEYPSLGSGHIDVAAQLQIGASGRTWYGSGEGGLRFRAGPPANEIPFALELGWSPMERWTLIGDARGHGFMGLDSDAAARETDFDPQLARSRVFAAGPGLAWTPQPKLRIAAQAWRTISGRNVPRGWTWKLAVARVR